MQDKLKWNAIGLVKKTRTLKDYIEREKNDTPIDHTKQREGASGYPILVLLFGPVKAWKGALEVTLVSTPPTLLPQRFLPKFEPFFEIFLSILLLQYNFEVRSLDKALDIATSAQFSILSCRARPVHRDRVSSL